MWGEICVDRLNLWPLGDELRVVFCVFVFENCRIISFQWATYKNTSKAWLYVETIILGENGLMLSRPVDLLFAIVELHSPTSRTVTGGIQKLPSSFNFLPHKLLSKVEQTKFSMVQPLDWAKVSANKWEEWHCSFFYPICLLFRWWLFIVWKCFCQFQLSALNSSLCFSAF